MYECTILRIATETRPIRNTTHQCPINIATVSHAHVLLTLRALHDLNERASAMVTCHVTDGEDVVLGMAADHD